MLPSHNGIAYQHPNNPTQTKQKWTKQRKTPHIQWTNISKLEFRSLNDEYLDNSSFFSVVLMCEL
jgi:hypothetical protein